MNRTEIVTALCEATGLTKQQVSDLVGNAMAREETYNVLRTFQDVRTLVLRNYVERVDVDRIMTGAMRGLAEGSGIALQDHVGIVLLVVVHAPVERATLLHEGLKRFADPLTRHGGSLTIFETLNKCLEAHGYCVNVRPERREAEGVEMQTGCAIPRPIQTVGSAIS